MSGYKRVNFYDLCRLCATHQYREKINIFEEKGRKIQLREKIQSCLSLQVCESDFLPKVVCSKCLESLEKSCIFRQECYTSETMLVSYFNNFRHTEEFKKSGKVYIKDVSQKSVATEVEIDLTLPSVPAVTMSTTSTNTDCGVNLVSNILPQEIMSSFYTLQIPQVTSIATTTPIIQQAAPLMTTMHESPKLVTQPQILYNNKVIPNVIKNNVGGAISIRVNSNGEIISTTPVLDINSYLNQQKIITQKKVLDSPTIVKIDLTNEADEPNSANQPIIYNQIQNNYNRGTNVNVISVPYETVVVNTNSTQQESPLPMAPHSPTVPVYNQHPPQPPDLFTPTSSQPSVNIFNPLSAKADYISTQDQSVVEKSKLFACSLCLKQFKKREHLYQHVKLHSGFRPYKCENCNKSYIRKEHLMRHLTSHNGEKKFTCEICERCFSRHDNLLKHKKIHDKLSYTCDVCNRKFMLEHFFLAHKSTHDVKCGIIGIS